MLQKKKRKKIYNLTSQNSGDNSAGLALKEFTNIIEFSIKEIIK